MLPSGDRAPTFFTESAGHNSVHRNNVVAEQEKKVIWKIQLTCY